MKKCISFLIAITMIFSLFTNVFAEGNTPVTIELQQGLDGYVGAKDVGINPGGNGGAGAAENIMLRSDISLYGLLYFDVSQIPAGATINSAYLNINYTGSNPCTVKLKRIIDPDNMGMWVEGTTVNPEDNNDGVSWYRRSGYGNHIVYIGTNTWLNNNGREVNSTILDSVVPTEIGSINIVSASAWHQSTSTDLKADIQTWVDDPTVNQGWFMDGNNYVWAMATAQNSDQSLKPKLVVTYTIPAKTYTYTAPGFGLTVDVGNKSLELAMTDLQDENAYQIWSEEEYGTDADSGSYWRLVKGYATDFTGADKNKVSWTVAGALSKTYKIFIRVKEPGGTIHQYTKGFGSSDVGLVRMNSISIGGVIPTSMIYKNTTDTIAIAASATASNANSNDLMYEYYFDSNIIKASEANLTSFEYSLATAAQGNHTIKVKVSQAGVAIGDEMSVDIFVNDPAIVVPEISGFGLTPNSVQNEAVSMNLGVVTGTDGNESYSYKIGEPGRGYFTTQYDTTSSYNFPYPGVYQVFGSVKKTTANSFSDGAIRYITIARKAVDGGTAITLSKDNVTINDSKYGNSTIDFAKGTPIHIVAEANVAGSQYSFWRLDARGYRLIKDWASGAGSNTLDWTPAQSGKYSISVRVRDAANNNPSASYEAAQSFNFNITGYAQTFNTVTITPTGGNVKRTLITIKADTNAIDVNKADLLYRFEISDSFMGTYTIQDYSTSDTTTWIPRKAGTYTMIVRVRDQASFGYYDTYATEPITIN